MHLSSTDNLGEMLCGDTDEGFDSSAASGPRSSYVLARGSSQGLSKLLN